MKSAKGQVKQKESSLRPSVICHNLMMLWVDFPFLFRPQAAALWLKAWKGKGRGACGKSQLLKKLNLSTQRAKWALTLQLNGDRRAGHEGREAGQGSWAGGAGQTRRRQGNRAGLGERQSTMRQLHGKHIRKPQKPLPRASGPATYDVATAVHLPPYPFLYLWRLFLRLVKWERCKKKNAKSNASENV